MGKIFVRAALLCLCLSLACRHVPETVPSVPSRLETFEGYASLKISRNGGTARSKFSFFFKLPNKGKIGVTNFLGQTLYQIYLDQDASYLVAPSKKAYWKGSQQEVINKFLGFRLTLKEMCFLLTGKKWGNQKTWNQWELRRDERGRVKEGRRDTFFFQVKEHFNQSSLVRLLLFRHPMNEGRIKVLAVNFNQAGGKSLFPLNLKNYEQKTWREIQRLIQDEG